MQKAFPKAAAKHYGVRLIIMLFGGASSRNSCFGPTGPKQNKKYIDVRSTAADPFKQKYTQFAMRWYSACNTYSKKHRNTRRNAAHFLGGNLVVRPGMSTLPKFRPKNILVIWEIILVILSVRAPQRSPVDTQGGSETTFS